MSKRKILVLAAIFFLILVFSFIGWQSLKEALFKGASYSTMLITSGIAFVLWGAAFGILFLISDNFIWPVLAFILGGLAFLSVFGIKAAYAAGLAFSLAIVCLAAWQASREKRFHIRVVPLKMLLGPLSMMFTLLALLAAIVFYFSPPAQDLAFEIKIPRKLFDFSINMAEGIIGGGQLSKSPLSLAIPGLSSFDLGQSKNVLGQIFGDKAKDSMYENLNSQLTFSLKNYKQYLPYGFAVAAFFALKALSFIFVWLAAGLAELIFFLMRTFGAVTFKKEMVEKEIIEI